MQVVMIMKAQLFEGNHSSPQFCLTKTLQYQEFFFLYCREYRLFRGESRYVIWEEHKYVKKQQQSQKKVGLFPRSFNNGKKFFFS